MARPAGLVAGAARRPARQHHSLRADQRHGRRELGIGRHRRRRYERHPGLGIRHPAASQRNGQEHRGTRVDRALEITAAAGGEAPEAIPIPERNAKKKPPRPERSTVAKNLPPEPEPENVVPFGQGGPISGPYGVFNAGDAKGGLSFSGGGDFGSRFGWYVDVVRRKISENWMKYEIDPRVTSGQRVYITFDILRNGQPTNVQIEQSSGIPSLDVSATRAIQRIDTFGALPNEYNGSKVSVEFWFDYRR